MACAETREVRFVIPSLPPSVNSLYEIRWRTKEVNLRPEARQWKSSSKQYVPRFVIAPESLLRIDFVFHYPYLYANGKLRVFDSANLIKLAVDCICEQLGVNDSRVKAGSWDSVDEEKEFVEVVLTEIRNVQI